MFGGLPFLSANIVRLRFLGMFKDLPSWMHSNHIMSHACFNKSKQHQPQTFLLSKLANDKPDAGEKTSFFLGP